MSDDASVENKTWAGDDASVVIGVREVTAERHGAAPTETIEVRNATYGTDERRVDVTKELALAVRRTVPFEFAAPKHTPSELGFGDPVPGQPKFLTAEIAYRLASSSESEGSSGGGGGDGSGDRTSDASERAFGVRVNERNGKWTGGGCVLRETRRSCDKAADAVAELAFQWHAVDGSVSAFVGHMKRIQALAAECDSVCEIGVDRVAATFALVHGLATGAGGGGRRVGSSSSSSSSSGGGGNGRSDDVQPTSSENKTESMTPATPPPPPPAPPKKFYVGIDIVRPPAVRLEKIQRLAAECGVAFEFLHQSSLEARPPATDLLFIDGLHTYAHVTTELERYHPTVRRYIALHDTEAPFGRADQAYAGDYSEYPSDIDRAKRGVRTAVDDFLVRREREWIEHEHHTHSYGFTILRRRRTSSPTVA